MEDGSIQILAENIQRKTLFVIYTSDIRRKIQCVW